MSDDSKLWEDFKNDKEYALSQIYHLNIKALLCYGKKFTSDTDIIKDACQDLFFDLIRTRKSLGSTDNIRFYLFKSLKRRIFSELVSASKRFDKVDYKDIKGNEYLFSFEEEQIKMENGIQNEELVQKAFKKISPKQHEILYYRFNCDFEYEQICEIMSMKYDSARKMVFRALKSIKAHLQESDIRINSIS